METKKKAGVAILVSDKTDFKPAKVNKDHNDKGVNTTRKADYPKYM